MTLMELMTVVLIIAILSVLFYPLVGWYQARAKRIVCAENLKGLFVSTTTYLNANSGIWPQIPMNSKEPQVYARSWHEILSPYGIGWQNLICPAVQAKVGNPDFTQPKLNRFDYVATRFDSKPWTARKWDHQPWFAERQDMHGKGNLLILTNGTLVDLEEARRIGQGSQPPLP
jgi:hypothetical protein